MVCPFPFSSYGAAEATEPPSDSDIGFSEQEQLYTGPGVEPVTGIFQGIMLIFITFFTGSLEKVEKKTESEDTNTATGDGDDGNDPKEPDTDEPKPSDEDPQG